MKLDLEKPGTDTSKKEPTAASAVEIAAAELADNALPLKKDQPSELLQPQWIAFINSMISKAVGEAVKGAMDSVVPAIQKLTEPTPLEKEQIETLAATKARFKREKAEMMERDEENRVVLAIKQKNCPHRYAGSESNAISPVHNFPDRQVRGVCMRCNLMITPREYRVAPPSVRTMAQANQFIAYIEKTEGVRGIEAYENPKTHVITHFLWPEHPLYWRVKEAEAKQGVA